MCSLVIGENLPAASCDNTSVDPGGASADETDTIDVDSVYEAVPPHYRRFLIVSHALSMILSICTHHHTLVTILLDHCLSSGLVHESTLLLHVTLAQALLPSNPNYPPPVTHPTHINYLLDLHTKWTTGNNPSVASSSSLLFTTSTFCQAVLGRLSQSSSSNATMLWTSKVLNRLLYAIESSDIDSHITYNPDKLSELMSSLFDLLFSQRDSLFYLRTPSRIYAIIDILHHCYDAQLHCFRIKPQGVPIDLPDIIVVFTTHMLVAFRNSIENPNLLLAILNYSKPIPQTFHKLMVHLTCSEENQTCGDFFESFLSELKSYSSALCSAELFTLEASLWACALRHFETSVASSQKGDSVLVMRYRRQLMEAVDTAERQCFGGDSCPVIPLSNYSKRAGPGPRTSKGWKWECAVDSWIRQTPVNKKRKLDEGHPHTPLRHAHSRIWDATNSKAVSSISARTPVSTCYRRSSSFSPTSSSSQLSDTEYRPEDGFESQDETEKENYPSSPSLKRPNWTRLSSVLAEAQKHRVVLHSKPCPQPEPPPSVIPEKYVPSLSSQESRAPRKRVKKDSFRKVSPPLAGSSRILLPSDDSLNLFACPTSSPPRC
ncbi:hypothetical protein JVU11DRAFT_2458 [Chiua virens]|nr:hypothetical protein JVU11DRAFT_2458 [Chiua virens]